jgi:hypothetical protein
LHISQTCLEFAPSLHGARHSGDGNHEAAATSSKQGVDGNEKAAIIGGSLRRKAFGFEGEAAESDLETRC